jgi:hypothetical protein
MKKIHISFVISLFLTLFLIHGNAQKKLHVNSSSTKIDMLNGSVNKPYLTISTALCNSQPGDQVVLTQDEYFINKNIIDKPIILSSTQRRTQVKWSGYDESRYRYNMWFGKGCHNCYEPQYANSINYALCHTRIIEIDIWDGGGGDGNKKKWRVVR